MKKYFIFALAAMAMVACSKKENAGLEPGDGAISFNPSYARVTKAEVGGTTAATALDNQFIVYGEKGETGKDAPATGNLVFQNYQVNYVENTANSTTSNTKGWEYVGYTHTTEYAASIATSTTDVQTIKYWDYGAASYTFTAVSAKQTDITAGNVKITKTTAGDATVYDKGYTIALTADASLANLYIADRLNIAKTAATGNKYGSAVTLKFRNMMSKVRVGMYETVPGYQVKIDKFYYTNSGASTANTANFVADVPNVAGGVAGTMTVKYVSAEGTTQNQPVVTFAPTESSNSKTYITLGTGFFGTDAAPKYLAESSATPSWDTPNATTATNGDYTSVFPQEDNTTAMVMKVDYTLFNSITKETITVEGATATIPAKYVAWKPNHSYTYIFKISDNTNGYTGGDSDPAGLYPITFDAVEVASEDGLETITTVSTPSITTYAHNSNVTADNEYKKDANIYVSLENPGTATLTTSNTKLYTATLEAGAANQGITEASVANCLENGSEYIKQTVVVGTTAVTGLYTKTGETYTEVTDADAKAAEGIDYYKKYTDKTVVEQDGKALTVAPATETLSIVTAIAAADSYTGLAIEGNFAKFTPAAAGTYVFEYSDGTNKHYKVIKVVE